MQSRRMLRALLVSLSLGAANLGCTAVPASPSYEADVRPIFEAHCTRCHGDGPDGGSLNNALEPVPDGGPIKSDPVSLGPTHAYLTQYADSDNCAIPDGGSLVPDSCHYGALTAVKSFGLLDRIHGRVPLAMPPAPAAGLDAYELKVIDAWAKNPICSNSNNPDPSICKPGVGP